MRGITTIAIGLNEKGAIYGKFAYNLALSIKHFSKVPVQLICNREGILHLSDDELKIFDVITTIKQEDYIRGLYMPSLAKMKMYGYLRYDETIYLDADTLVIKDITPLFDECKDDYLCTVVGQADDTVNNFREMQWCDINYLREHYNLNGNIMPATNSSFQFIRKGKVCEELFKQINKNFDNKVPDDKLGLTWGSGKQPDELYLNVALCQLGMMPKMKEPICYKVNERYDKSDKEKYYAFSYYGGKGFTHSSLVDQYDRELRAMTKNGGHFYKINNLMKNKYVDTK